MSFEDIKQRKISAGEALLLQGKLKDDERLMGKGIEVLMAYRAIDKNNKQYKEFIKRYGQDFMKCQRDLRNEESYTCKWVYAEYPYKINTQVEIPEHKGLRVEGVYQGEMKVESRDMPIIIEEVKLTQPVKNAVINIKKALKENRLSLADKEEDIVNKIDIGKLALFQVKTRGNFLRNEFGYIIVAYTGKKTAKANIFLEPSAIEYVKVRYNEMYRVVSEVFKKEFEAYSKLRVDTATPYKIE